ncbi:hypothetical protein ACOMHN_041158 [Nucella lapillus]
MSQESTKQQRHSSTSNQCCSQYLLTSPSGKHKAVGAEELMGHWTGQRSQWDTGQDRGANGTLDRTEEPVGHWTGQRSQWDTGQDRGANGTLDQIGRN